MEANPSKFQFMLMKSFTSKELLRNFIDINDTRNERQSHIKLLGISIDDKRKFDKHIDILCKNAAGGYHRYRMIGQTVFVAHWVGHNYFPLYPSDMINVEPGDTIGIYFPKYNPIPWNAVPCT